MKLYFARHGQTDANANMVAGQSISELDEPLNQIGVTQAKMLAEQLKGIEFDTIISSPLKRANQTAEVVNMYHNTPIQIDDAWREREAGDGIDETSWNNMFDFDENMKIENGEQLADFFERVYTALDNIQAKYRDKTVLIVSHGGVQHAVYAYANRLPLSGNMRISRLRNCEYRVYDLREVDVV